MNNMFGNALQNIGGLLGQNQATGNQSGSQWYGQPLTAQQLQMLQMQPQMALRHVKDANNFKSLTAYLRALTACEEHCECKWCAASELERKMAIVLFLKPTTDEDEDE